MGAKTNIIITGFYEEINFSFLNTLLKQLKDVIDDKLGSLRIVSIHDFVSGTSEDFDYIDFKPNSSLKPEENKIIFIYPVDFQRGSISFYFEGKYWLLCFSLEASQFSMSDIEATMHKIWGTLREESPFFIASGREMEVTEDDITSILNRKKSVIDIDLCDIAIEEGKVVNRRT